MHRAMGDTQGMEEGSFQCNTIRLADVYSGHGAALKGRPTTSPPPKAGTFRDPTCNGSYPATDAQDPNSTCNICGGRQFDIPSSSPTSVPSVAQVDEEANVEVYMGDGCAPPSGLATDERDACPRASSAAEEYP